ncbi:uncharacterized protein LOC131025662 [Salvia miltiorrhiza]|uniref:uncharacterized protein LOC131025662 n=1 Tax=Salvia miltiorrhiza TaxID=226208 RepID=UPI0025AD7DF8|nr:uncharacterized protein LOC131025662 [Salvia miltiorrhiza]
MVFKISAVVRVDLNPTEATIFEVPVLVKNGVSKDEFACYFHIKGRFEEVEVEGGVIDCHTGGLSFGRYDLDVDRFGYFDLLDLIEKLGMKDWERLTYLKPKSNSYIVIYSDQEVMEMLSYLIDENRVVHVFVEGGVKVRPPVELHNSRTVPISSPAENDTTNVDENAGNEPFGHYDYLDKMIDDYVGSDAEFNEESSEDSNYIQPDVEDSDCGLTDLDFTSGDDEYVESKKKMKGKDVSFKYIDDDTVGFLGDEELGANVSDYASSEGNVDSSESDEEGQGKIGCKARSIAKELVRGSVVEHYGMLGRYLAELRRVDSQGRFELLLGEEHMFKVRTTNQAQYKAALLEMKKENALAFEGFVSRDVNKFSKEFLSFIACSDMIDNNINETFNGWILNAREKHIIHILEEIRTSLMSRQVQKLEKVKDSSDCICPGIRKKLENLRFQSRHCIAAPALGGKFEITFHEDKFVVFVEGKECACRVWQLIGIPCVHAICAIQYMSKDPVDYLSNYYSMEMYRATYDYALEPVNGPKMWPKVEGFTVKPLAVRKMPGRPKIKRKRAAEEDPKNPGHLRRFGQLMTCQNCLQIGHNKKTCKNEKVQKPTEKRKRGRPRKEGQGT